MRKYRIIAAVLACLGGVQLAQGAQVVTHEKYDLTMPDRYYVASDAADKTSFPKGLNAAFGSGLAFDGVDAKGRVKLLSVTDRGPNLDGMDVIYKGKKYSSKLFPAPDFHPEIGEIVLDKASHQAKVVKVTPLRDEKGTPISGRPIPFEKEGSSGEVALSTNLKVLPFDTNGLDTESIAVDKKGYRWISDEYGPFVVKVDKEGRIVAKYGPRSGLPPIIANRTPNRGAEGLTVLPNGHVFFLVQSIIEFDGKTKNAGFTRLYDWNPKTQEYKTYAYPLDTTYKKMGDAKLGDALALDNNRILIIEQGKLADKSMMNRVYLIDLRKGKDITNLKINNQQPEFAKAKEMAPYMVSKDLVLDLRQYGWNTEKAEGLTISPDHKTLSVANDNDFGIATKIVDKENPKADVKDYLYNADTNQMYVKVKAGDKEVYRPANPTIEMEQGPDKPEVWSFTFDKALK